MKYPPERHTGVVTPITLLTLPNSDGQLPVIHKMLRSESPLRARVIVVVPSFRVRHAVHAGLAQVAKPASTAAVAASAPNAAGALAGLMR
jgi:hypothetical protein